MAGLTKRKSGVQLTFLPAWDALVRLFFPVILQTAHIFLLRNIHWEQIGNCCLFLFRQSARSLVQPDQWSVIIIKWSDLILIMSLFQVESLHWVSMCGLLIKPFETCSVQCTLYNLQSTIYNLQSIIYNLLSTIYNLKSTLYKLQSTIYNLKFKFYIVQSTIYNIRIPWFDNHGELSPLLHCEQDNSKEQGAVAGDLGEMTRPDRWYHPEDKIIRSYDLDIIQRIRS